MSEIIIGNNVVLRGVVVGLLLSVASGAGCSRNDEVLSGSPSRSVHQESKSVIPGKVEHISAVPSLHLKVYPDMAVPGKEVVVEVELVPNVVSEQPRIRFKTLEDPCDGRLEQSGPRVTYHVPADCRGSSISLEILVSGTFGDLRESIDLDIKKTSIMDSVVFTYPVPGQKLLSPVSVWWDRSLYHNREETLSFRVKRFNRYILSTGNLDPGQVIELDIPHSPENTVLFGETSSGSQETALIRVHSRRVPEWSSRVLMLDRFVLPDTNSMDAPRTVLKDGGECVTGMARRISVDGEMPFLYMHYHVSKAKRYGRTESLLGISEQIPVRATRADYKELEIWLRGDPVRGCASPVYVRLKGSRGSEKRFKIKRLKAQWRPYHFPLYRALRSGKNERLKEVQVFVDAKDVTPPLGTILFGGMYLVPHNVGKSRPDEERNKGTSDWHERDPNEADPSKSNSGISTDPGFGLD
jgi:hypothetical protein